MKKSTLDKLSQRQLQLVLTYAPAGLGHLRVTDALYHGLPEAVNPVVLGSQDKSIQTIHRITSIHPLGRRLFEWLQSGPLSSLSNRLYRSQLRSGTSLVYEEMARLIDERFEPLKEVLVVSTHFGLAHKLAAIKERLQKEKRVKIILAVVVTDDTFQHIWYVDGADVIVVPSHFTQEKYIVYSRSLGGSERIEVLPYPLSPHLGKQLSAQELTEKVSQLDAQGKELIRVSIPISGAAVGTDKSLRLIEALREKSERFRFYVVSKDAPYTRDFLARIAGRSWIDVHAASLDREVVDTYDNLFEDHLIALEVTKPSEQAFKALFGTQSRGGVILLFSEPVGKQEFDNIDFLQRHSLVPSTQTNTRLWEMAKNNVQVDDAARAQLLDEAFTWRGVKLPSDSQEAAGFIWWMLATGVFARMMTCNAHPTVRNSHPDEVSADGVAQFWDLVTSV
jgi:hypothetical protein